MTWTVFPSQDYNLRSYWSCSSLACTTTWVFTINRLTLLCYTLLPFLYVFMVEKQQVVKYLFSRWTDMIDGSSDSFIHHIWPNGCLVCGYCCSYWWLTSMSPVTCSSTCSTLYWSNSIKHTWIITVMMSSDIFHHGFRIQMLIQMFL